MPPGSNLYVDRNIRQDSFWLQITEIEVKFCYSKRFVMGSYDWKSRAVKESSLCFIWPLAHLSTLLSSVGLFSDCVFSLGDRWPPAASCLPPTYLDSWKKENLPFPTFPEIRGLTLIVTDWSITGSPSLDQFQKHGDKSGLSGQGQAMCPLPGPEARVIQTWTEIGTGRFVNENQGFVFG